MTLAKSALTREAILDAARKTFARKGYSGTSITELAQGLHVTRANFYYYFRDKKELFIALGTETYRQTITVIDRFDDLDEAPSIEQVTDWVQDYFDYLDDAGAFLVRSMEDGPDDPEFRSTVRRLHKRSARRLGEHMGSRTSGGFSSTVSLGMSIMAMLERSWLLSHTETVDFTPEHAIRGNAEILTSLMRRCDSPQRDG